MRCYSFLLDAVEAEPFDWTPLLVCGVLIVIIYIGLWLWYRHRVRSDEYSQTRSKGIVSGREVVRLMMAQSHIEGVSVIPYDFMIQRYYYSPRRRAVVMPTQSCYGSGLYDVVRAATLSTLAVQCIGQKNSGLYFCLSPIFEFWSRIMPLALFVCILLACKWMVIGVGLLLLLYVGSICTALMMRPTEKAAAQQAYNWLLSNNIVAAEESRQLSKVVDYVCNYNLNSAFLSIFVIFNKAYRIRIV